jgi:hypothetical protein
MNDVFHENAVIWKRASAWDAFGFFGGGGSGKTTLSFDFALRLLRDQTLDLRIFDDRFILDSQTIQRDGDNTWGREDGLGKRREFEEEANSQNKQLNDFLPAKGDQYSLGHVTIWFLDHRDGLEYYRESLGFMEFLELLTKKDPFHVLKNPTVNDLMPCFKREWKYELILLPKPVSVLETLGQLAYWEKRSS